MIYDSRTCDKYIPDSQLISVEEIHDQLKTKYPNYSKLRRVVSNAYRDKKINKYKEGYYINDLKFWEWLKNEKGIF
jgi:hypothetical protein